MKISAWKLNIFAAILVLISFGFTYSKKIQVNSDYRVFEPLNYTVSAEETAPYFNPPFLGRALNGFKEDLAFKESGGDYFVVNQLGYMGKYQFGKSTLKLIGIYNPHNFLKDTELQERAFMANLERNKWVLRKDIERYVGRTFNGIKVTESGILAAAHLVGAGNVKKYLRSGGQELYEDGNGVSIMYYMKKFSGYDVSVVAPNRSAKI